MGIDSFYDRGSDDAGIGKEWGFSSPAIDTNRKEPHGLIMELNRTGKYQVIR